MDMWTYNWLYIPTGETGVTTQSRFSPACVRFKTLLEAINHWNGADKWKYWV